MYKYGSCLGYESRRVERTAEADDIQPMREVTQIAYIDRAKVMKGNTIDWLSSTLWPTLNDGKKSVHDEKLTNWFSPIHTSMKLQTKRLTTNTSKQNKH